jgi:transposase
MVDRGDAGRPIGEELPIHAGVLFDAWSKVRAGEFSRAAFAAEIPPRLRREARARSPMESGSRCGSRKAAATCREILGIEPSSWTFATVGGVEPTNDQAERSSRQAARRRPVRRAHPRRRQGRDPLDFRVEAVSAHRKGVNGYESLARIRGDILDSPRRRGLYRESPETPARG